MAHVSEERMVSMKRPVKMDTPEYIDPVGKAYGYGLCLRLERWELDRLGIAKLPEVGTVFEIEAKAYVESVHESKSANNEGDRCVSLQITHLAIEGMGED
jgi:hypothetical protein